MAFAKRIPLIASEAIKVTVIPVKLLVKPVRIRLKVSPRLGRVMPGALSLRAKRV